MKINADLIAGDVAMFQNLKKKIDIIYTLVLQEEKVFPVIPRSEWSTHQSLRYAQKCPEIWVKRLQQNYLPLHIATPW